MRTNSSEKLNYLSVHRTVWTFLMFHGKRFVNQKDNSYRPFCQSSSIGPRNNSFLLQIR
jgi:hypothetical protein